MLTWRFSSASRTRVSNTSGWLPTRFGSAMLASSSKEVEWVQRGETFVFTVPELSVTDVLAQTCCTNQNSYGMFWMLHDLPRCKLVVNQVPNLKVVHYYAKKNWYVCVHVRSIYYLATKKFWFGVFCPVRMKSSGASTVSYDGSIHIWTNIFSYSLARRQINHSEAKPDLYTKWWIRKKLS